MSAKGDWSDRPVIDAREGGATTTGSLELLLHRFRLKRYPPEHAQTDKEHSKPTEKAEGSTPELTQAN